MSHNGWQQGGGHQCCCTPRCIPVREGVKQLDMEINVWLLKPCTLKRIERGNKVRNVHGGEAWGRTTVV